MEVTVLRNLNVPVFRNVPYTADIERTVEDDTVIATVEATDEDSSVSDMSYVTCCMSYVACCMSYVACRVICRMWLLHVPQGKIYICAYINCCI